MIENDHDEIRMRGGISHRMDNNQDQNKRINFQPGIRKEPTSYLESMIDESSFDTNYGQTVKGAAAGKNNTNKMA